ncbi:MAG: hypothetical protein EHM75_00510 [Desulfobacteraceae bacterium]|nr:MAG: hypothetical protein EHM75_00510 [Desulfobacteraceae bacterium]
MTATAPNGQKLFEGSKFYMPQAGDGRSPIMSLGPDKKLGLLRDTSIQPFRPKEETFEIPVPKGINEINVAVRLTYQPRPGNIYPLHSLSRQIRIETP